jgi:hypothetical protein
MIMLASENGSYGQGNFKQGNNHTSHVREGHTSMYLVDVTKRNSWNIFLVLFFPTPKAKSTKKSRMWRTYLDLSIFR